MNEPLTTELHCPVCPQVASRKGTLHCLILHDDQRITSCHIPEMHVVIGTKFCVDRQAWRIVEICDGVEGCDKVLKCTKEYS